MKRLFIYLLFILTSVLPMAPVLITGCTTSQERKVYNSLYSVGASVDASYKSYLDLVIQGKLATNDVPRISGYYADFQRIFAAAVAANGVNKNALPSPEVSSAASRITSAITQAKGLK